MKPFLKAMLSLCLLLGFAFTTPARADSSGIWARAELNQLLFGGREATWRNADLETRCGIVVKNDRALGTTLIAVGGPTTDAQWTIQNDDQNIERLPDHDRRSGIVSFRDSVTGQFLRMQVHAPYGIRLLSVLLNGAFGMPVQCEVRFW